MIYKYLVSIKMLQGSTEYDFPQTLQALQMALNVITGIKAVQITAAGSRKECACVVGFSGDGLRVRKIKIVFFGLSSYL